MTPFWWNPTCLWVLYCRFGIQFNFAPNKPHTPFVITFDSHFTTKRLAPFLHALSCLKMSDSITFVLFQLFLFLLLRLKRVKKKVFLLLTYFHFTLLAVELEKVRCKVYKRIFTFQTIKVHGRKIERTRMKNKLNTCRWYVGELLWWNGFLLIFIHCEWKKMCWHFLKHVQSFYRFLSQVTIKLTKEINQKT